MTDFYVEPPRRRCEQCGRRVLSFVSKALYCKPCKAVRRERSRTVPRVPLRGASAWDLGHNTGHTHESADRIDRLLEHARQARLADERRNGRRRYTTDPWEQRPGAGVWNDGDTQGEGFS